MAKSIQVKFRDGTDRKWSHGYPAKGEPPTVTYTHGWVIVTGNYGDEFAFPSDLVKEIITIPTYDRRS